MRNAVLRLLLIVTIAVLSTGCEPVGGRLADSAAAQSADNSAKRAVIAKVELRDFTDNKVIPVSLIPNQTVDIVSRVEGYIGEIHVDIGDEVKPRQKLITLHIPELVAEVALRKEMIHQAEADLTSLRAQVDRAASQAAEVEAMQRLRKTELDRVAEVVRSGALTKSKQDEARFAHEMAAAGAERVKAEVAAAEAKLEGGEAAVAVARAEYDKAAAMAAYLEINAPFAGSVTHRAVDPGTFVRPPGGNGQAMPLLRIEQTDKLRGVLMVPLSVAARLDDGDNVTIHSLQGSPAQQLVAKITRHSGAFDTDSRMLRAEVDLENPIDPETGKRKLRSGDYGKASVNLHEFQAVPAVPETAVGSDADGSYVLRVDANGKASKTMVKVAAVDDGWAAITSGLSASDQVVAKDVDRYQDGQEVSTD